MWAKGKQLPDFPTFDFSIQQKAGLFMKKFLEVATRIQQASAKLRNVFVKALLWC